MDKLHFRSTEEFEDIFKPKRKYVTDVIVNSIEQAILGNKRTANLFEITFDNVELAFEISLPRSQWVFALENCVKHYHELELVDEQIDTWKLLEAAKVY